MDQPDFTMGIEEEYLVVDLETGALADVPPELHEACRRDLGDQVAPELMRCQIEIGSKVCATIGEAREDLTRLRRVIADHAEGFGLAPIAAACHPFSDWRDQHTTPKKRYEGFETELQWVARRALICGMHVHVGIPDEDMRVDLVNQALDFLPLFLALSGSSPFWQGEDTGLASYRTSVFGNMPRSGLPPRFTSWGEYRRTVEVLVETGIIDDTTEVWWDLRPSDRFPTIESRICDTCPRVEDALTLAALFQATVRMLWRLSQRNQRWREYDRFLIAENRWRAQRYGTTEGQIDYGRRRLIPVADKVAELCSMLAEDAGALGSSAEVARARDLATEGTGATRMRAVLARARDGGADEAEAMRAVVQSLVTEFREGL